MLIENMENEKKEESIMKQKKKVKITGFIDTSIVRNGKKTVLTVERDGRNVRVLTSPVLSHIFYNGHVYVETMNTIYMS